MSQIARDIVFIGENESLRKILEKKEFTITRVITDSNDIVVENINRNIIIVNDRKIVKDDIYREVPAVFCLNSYNELGQNWSDHSNESYDYVTKPYDTNELINKIESLIRFEKVKADFDEVERKNERLEEMLYEINRINKKLILKAQR